ncbi:MAG: hypothetical protein ACPHID_08245 [Thermoplasmatota archaeon]
MNREQWMGVMPFLVGIASFAGLAAFNEARGFDLWRNYALSGFFLGGATTWVLLRYDVRLPHYIQWVIVGALWTHYGGGSLGSPDPYRMGLLGMHGINGAYHHFDWWDHLTHGVGIGASAMGIAYLFEVYQARRGLQWSASRVFLLTMLASLTAGVAVELYEFLGKQAFQTIDQGGYENTMRDLHFNLIGALVGAGVAIFVNRTQFRERILARWVHDDPVPHDAPWWRQMTPPMTGFIFFTAVPALTALFLATQFFSQAIPPDDGGLYDQALWTLTGATAAALVVGPMATLIHRRRLA